MKSPSLYHKLALVSLLIKVTLSPAQKLLADAAEIIGLLGDARWDAVMTALVHPFAVTNIV
jgi:predicted permease